MVERGPEKAGVGGSIPSLATTPPQKRSKVSPPQICGTLESRPLSWVWRMLARIFIGQRKLTRIQSSMFKEGGSNESDAKVQSPGVLRNYRAPWKGQLLLACRKCQKKLRHRGKKNGPAQLNKALKKRARLDEAGLSLRVIGVPCLNLCPKGGVTVCTQQQIANNECSIVRSRADVDALFALCKAQSEL